VSPAFVIAGGVIYLAVGLLVWAGWIFSGTFTPVAAWFAYTDAPFLMLVALLEFVLASQAAGQFEADEPLHTAWQFVGAAAGLRVLAMVMGHWLGVKTPLNPIVWAGRPVPDWIKPSGLFLGGAPTMALLAAGLWRVIRLYRRLGFGRKLRLPDWLLLGAACAYVLWTFGLVIRLMYLGQKTAGIVEMISWTADPLLCVLLFEALLLLRSVRVMGGGLVADCWLAYVIAIALTIAGDISIWVESYQLVPWPWRSLGWYIWYAAAIAYTAAPAFQLEAISKAYQGQADNEQTLTLV
jgi:hypothetical protein